MQPGVRDALNHSKLFLSITNRVWDNIFNLLTLFLYTNLFLFCEMKYINIVILKVFIQIFLNYFTLLFPDVIYKNKFKINYLYLHIG